jgi:AcrR family transcriptional regulator
MARIPAKKKTSRRLGKPSVSRGPTGVQLGEDSVRGMVLEGAARVFSEHGVRDTAVDQILITSRISRRTFYRFYESKEAVMVALYHIGTQLLIEGCQTAMRSEGGPLQHLEGCMEVHLTHARASGRLMFVLGGEAQRHESLLFPRRMETHEAIARLLTAEFDAHFEKAVDPWFARALIFSMEGTTRLALQECDEGRRVTDDSLERARQVMLRIASAILGQGEGSR